MMCFEDSLKSRSILYCLLARSTMRLFCFSIALISSSVFFYSISSESKKSTVIVLHETLA
jgi:hypothetical protein